MMNLLIYVLQIKCIYNDVKIIKRGNKMNTHFFCYSYPLKEYFVKNGLQYITSAINQNTGKKYWLFEGCEKLNNLLAIWRSNK